MEKITTDLLFSYLFEKMSRECADAEGSTVSSKNKTRQYYQDFHAWMELAASWQLGWEKIIKNKFLIYLESLLQHKNTWGSSLKYNTFG